MASLRFLPLLALVLAAPLAATAQISVQISPPGVYGRVDIDGLPQPRLILPQPVIIRPPPLPRVDVAIGQPPQPAPQPPRVVAQPQPIYMWVPPGHQRDWKKHCYRYNACGMPVYFVHNDWYQDHVHPRGRGRGHGKDDRDDDKGRGRGHGGKGKD
jgi:hypothetical protein